jgi:predicted thioredoxin/glutaredoxin
MSQKINIERKPRVVLYTRSGCHLCEVAEEVLRAHGLAPEIVDIDVDPDLRTRFDTCVPVVEIDGRVRFRGRVDPELLRRILKSLGLED